MERGLEHFFSPRGTQIDKSQEPVLGQEGRAKNVGGENSRHKESPVDLDIRRFQRDLESILNFDLGGSPNVTPDMFRTIILPDVKRRVDELKKQIDEKNKRMWGQHKEHTMDTVNEMLRQVEDRIEQIKNGVDKQRRA